MAMEINSVYGNYASTYTNSKETKQVKNSKSTSEVDKTEGQQTYSVENTKQNGADMSCGTINNGMNSVTRKVFHAIFCLFLVLYHTRMLLR